MPIKRTEHTRKKTTTNETAQIQSAAVDREDQLIEMKTTTADGKDRVKPPLVSNCCRYLSLFTSESTTKSLITHLVVLLSVIEILSPTTRMVSCGSVDYCYSDIGCFPLSEEFYHPRHRPFNVRPWHRRRIRTEFELFSAQFPDGIVIEPWRRVSLLASQFNPKLETKVIIPGWLDNIDRAVWVKQLRDALLWAWSPINLIVVRWRNFTPYTIATANTRVVGAELANLIRFIEHELAYDRSYYHLIGHSLGAHIGGYCGDRVPGLGRITALDPARPFFQGMPKSVRLDRGDARFVDAIHSDFTPENAIFLLMSFGMTTPVGHVDFYPNGPPLLQPGCLRDTLGAIQRGIINGLRYSSFQVTFTESLRYLTACDHQRAHEWFLESITNRECVFVGVRCNEYEGMINGRCTCDDSPSACAIMGIHADQMYLNGVHEDVWPLGSSTARTRQMVGRKQQPHHLHKSPIDFGLAPLAAAAQPAISSATAALMDYSPAGHVVEPSSSLKNDHDGPTREAILAQLRMELSQMRRPSEPAPSDEYLMSMMMMTEPSNTDSQVLVGSDSSSSPMIATDDQQQQQQQVDATLIERLQMRMLENQQREARQRREREQEQLNDDALDDSAFIEYLRAIILEPQSGGGGDAKTNQSTAKGNPSEQNSVGAADELSSTAATNKHVSYDDDDQRQYFGKRQNHSSSTIDEQHRLDDNHIRRRQDFNHHQMFHDEQSLPPHINGHPKLMSDYVRNVEDWYEESSRWFLKTNNRPNYCSNQYQVMVFVGPLKARRNGRSGGGGHDRLRANLIISIIGSRGQLLNQRFVPRSASLDSFTMQPFFILLEGSYSLGQIESVAIGWEQRHDPDPIQATISFQNNQLANLQMSVPALKAKHPWLAETVKYDLSAAFQWKTGSVSGHDKYMSRRQSSVVSSSTDRPQKRGQKHRHAANSGWKRRVRRSSEDPSRRGKKVPKKIIKAPQQSCHSSSCDKLMKRTDQEWLDDYVDVVDHDPLAEADDGLSAATSQSDAIRRAEASSIVSHLLPAQPYLSFAGGSLAEAMQPTSHMDGRESALFEPLVEPLVDHGLLVDKAKALETDKQMSVDLHFLDHLQKQVLAGAAKIDSDLDDSIIINQVVVSPLQPSYGGSVGLPNAKAFCPPRRGSRLRQERTIRLRRSLTSRCYEGQVLKAGY